VLYVVVATGTTANTNKISFGTTGACTVTTVDNLVTGTALLSNGYYFLISTTAVSLTAPTFYVATYSAAACDDDVYSTQETITNDATCAAQTVNTAKYDELSFTTAANFNLAFGCA